MSSVEKANEQSQTSQDVEDIYVFTDFPYLSGAKV
jgi:hypothetical protein